MRRWRRPSLRVTAVPRIDASVSTPIAPTWRPRKTTPSPNSDQCVAMSTTASPVTQIVETAVNRACGNGVMVPSAEEIGSISTNVSRKIMPVKASTAKRLGECVLMLVTQSRTRPRGERRAASGISMTAIVLGWERYATAPGQQEDDPEVNARHYIPQA